MMIPEDAYVPKNVFRKYKKKLSRSFTNSCDQIHKRPVGFNSHLSISVTFIAKYWL